MITVTGRQLAVNGAAEVPIGLFGVHATKLDAARIADWGIASERLIHKQPSGVPLRPEQVQPGLVHLVECLYDRYQPALVLTDPEWERSLAELGRRYGEHARATGRTHLLEFWNEPYLNWSCKPAVNYDGRHYDLAGAAEGAPVTLRGQATEHLVWKRGLLGHDAETGEVNHVFAGYAPRGLKAGDTFPIRGRTYVMREVWMAHDPTQEFYWAGQQNSLWYRRMYRVFAESLKRANPDVTLAGGWGFNLWNEGWACWERLVRPLLDDCLPLMDAVHEHHYGGDTRLVAASYEVATAYTDARGRRLQFWNTEAGGQLDPQQPDTPTSGHQGSPLQQAVGSMTYMLRDIVHLLDVCPDKARARAAHQAELNGGDEFAFRLLKPLRGRLIEVRGGDATRWCVASLDGPTLAVVCFNDGREDAEVPLRIAAPAGTRLVAGRILGVRPRADGQGLELTDEPWPIDGALSVAVPAKGARTLVLTLDAAPAALPLTAVEQHFAHGVLATVAPGAELTRTISLPAAALAGAVRARLKLVLADQDVDCRLSVNGHAVPLPPAGTWTARVDLDPALLSTETRLVFSAGPRPLRVLMASVELITEP